ncbi:MAG: superoxide dismutase family protein [Candidatus Berkiella sp.]
MRQDLIFKAKILLLSTLLSTALLAQQDEKVQDEKIIQIHALNQNESTQGIGEAIGSVTLKDTSEGMALTIRLKDIPAGEHGFHIHENPSCAFQIQEGKVVSGALAGGHYDPHHTKIHAGPGQKGHLGDLQKLIANQDNIVEQEMIAPDLKIADIMNRAFIIHEKGDNYSDEPLPLGGGGARIACGVIN